MVKLGQFFTGFAAKRLVAIEVDPAVSNGHEFQGSDRLRGLLGTPATRVVYSAIFILLNDGSPPVSVAATASWYDSRANQPKRSSEFRLYYPAEATDLLHSRSVGDLAVFALRNDGTLVIWLAGEGSSAEQQLLWLTGLQADEQAILPLGGSDGASLDAVTISLLENAGVQLAPEPPPYSAKVIEKFPNGFPTTAVFSRFARQIANLDKSVDPDIRLIEWMNTEENLFLALENYIVSDRLKAGFLQDGEADVNGFIKFSLSVQNRRKSRAGFALSHHVHQILLDAGVRHEREACTEAKAKPDFLFPGSACYHNAGYPNDMLRMLGVKTSAKDRWRQVLAEADRIDRKHLLTLEAAISEPQTDEMLSRQLQLVIPAPVHASYSPRQQASLLTVGGLIEHLLEVQKRADASGLPT